MNYPPGMAGNSSVFTNGQYAPPISPRPSVAPFPPAPPPLPPQFVTTSCPGVPVQLVEEHRLLLEGSIKHQHLMQGLHIQLCASQARLDGQEEVIDRMELRLAELEGRQDGDLRKGQDQIGDIGQELRQGEKWLTSVSNEVADLTQSLQRLSRKLPVGAGVGVQAGAGTRAGAVPRERGCQTGPPDVSVCDPMTPFASAAPPPYSTRSSETSTVPDQCTGGSPTRRTARAQSSSGDSPIRKMTTLGLVFVSAIILGMSLKLPTVCSSTVPNHPTLKGSDALVDNPSVSSEYSLKALHCAEKTARVYPTDSVCRRSATSSSLSSFSSAPASITRRRAYLVQKNSYQTITIHKCSKRTSTQSTHCGLFSWSSPEGFQDRVYERTRVHPSECQKAVRQGLWVDPNAVIHEVSVGHNVISYVATGALDYSSQAGTWSCRGGRRADGQGHSEMDVLERAHVQLSLTTFTARYSIRDGSVQLDEETVLPSDRWSSSGAAVIEGEVFLRDPGTPPPVCNLRLIRGPLTFLIMEPADPSEGYFTAINTASRIKISYRRSPVPIPKECLQSIGQHRHLFQTNYNRILLLVEDETNGAVSTVTLAEEITEVNLRLQLRSQVDYLDWASNLRLDDLTEKMREDRCLANLVEDYRIRSNQQSGWRIIHRGELMLMMRCMEVEVRPYLHSPKCSEQLLVLGPDDHQYRLHAGSRILTDHGVEVPCSLLLPHFTFLTKQGVYVQQNPGLKPVAFNFTLKESSLPDFLTPEEDKILVNIEKTFEDGGGLYTEQEVDVANQAYLREWSIISGTPPEVLLTPKVLTPSASAAASAHQKMFSSSSDLALRGIEELIRGTFSWTFGRVLSSFERLLVSGCMILGNLYACLLLLHRILTALFSCMGCCGPNSQSWKRTLCWVLFPSCTLASEARRGFQQVPNPAPTPSAPLDPDECPGLMTEDEDDGRSPSYPPGRGLAPTVARWKASRRSRKRPQAPLAPPPDRETALASGRDECNPAPLLSGTPPPPPPPSRKPSQEGGRPPAHRTRPPGAKRSQSSPRPASSSSLQEDSVELQVPSSADILTGYRNVTRALYVKK